MARVPSEDRDRVQARARNALHRGLREMEAGNLDAARNPLRLSLRLYSKVGDPDAVASVFETIAKLDVEEHHYSSALRRYQSAADQWLALDKAANAAHALTEASRIADAMDDLQRSLALSHEALRLARTATSEEQTASALVALARAEARLGGGERARDHVDVVMASIEQRRDSIQVIEALSILGTTALGEGDIDLAQTEWTRALDIAVRSSARRWIVDLRAKLADLALRQQDYATAAALVQSLLADVHTRPERRRAAELLVSLGDTARVQGMISVAREHYRSGLAQYSESGYGPGMREARQRLADTEPGGHNGG
jgi:tetratricopeptide (TPR) repeat protein